jgi:hypothetical protein
MNIGHSNFITTTSMAGVYFEWDYGASAGVKSAVNSAGAQDSYVHRTWLALRMAGAIGEK